MSFHNGKNPASSNLMDQAKPTVIGIYGIPGSGKSVTLEYLRKDLGEEEFAFFEGSEVIASLIPGGLAAFQKLTDDEKYEWRVKAINHIKDQAITSSRVAVVTGHFSFWYKENGRSSYVLTDDDWDTFTHIIYLKPDEQTILSNIANKILSLDMESPMPWNALTYVRNFKKPATAEANMSEVMKLMSEVEEDEWKLDGSLVSDIFRGPMGYSDDAFRQATLLLEEKCTDEVFERHCNTVSASVSLRPEFLSLLRLVAQKKHIGAVVVTYGVGRLWTKVLEHHGLADSVKVIGGGRFSSGYIVTPGVKAAVVSQLRDVHELYVWAFGDSPFDIPMLWEADQAIVVVGEQGIRSKTMDEELEPVIREHHLRARQVLLPTTASPRLDTSTLPVVIMDEDFVNSIVDPRPDRQPLKIFDATHKAAAKLLMPPMRDAAVFGPMLRQAHANVGRYLATEYVSELIGLEDYAIPHVQGHNTTGYYLRNEATTSIVALMRGGEPMAFGVSDVFPQAMFIHASAAEDVKMHHVQGQSNVILVDSVVNSGKSVIEFIKRVVRIEPNVNITVVAGVVQADAIAEGHLFAKVMKRHGAGLVALRVSENKFTGTKTTDTGNRLFNTTHLA
ncbi:PRTase [Fusarium circinatum]|uniref:PRTase n=1 Tax=Fusarium circinatum TaxID=48490 RepID=A0A8H5TFW0_FUSCI|nr:PRTase [Fusarium circinatum]